MVISCLMGLLIPIFPLQFYNSYRKWKPYLYSGKGIAKESVKEHIVYTCNTLIGCMDYALMEIKVYMVHLNIALFRFNLKALEPIVLPSYKGSAIRGGFGYAFKRVSCAIKNKECPECLLKEKCVYSYVFETPLPSGTSIMRKYRSVPHPFIIEPPQERRMSYKAGDEISFKLTLVGKAIDYLPYFIYSFHELGGMGIGKGRGKYELKSVENFDVLDRQTGTWKPVYNAETKVLKSFNSINMNVDTDITEQNPDDEKQLSINFDTPTRILFNQQLAVDLEFHIFIRQLIRRLSLLSYFHCGQEKSDTAFKQIIAKAQEVKVQKKDLRWFDWERYSTRQNTRIKLGGFVGGITFKGNIEPFMPIIKAGELLHVGKGTSFGLGKYQIRAFDKI